MEQTLMELIEGLITGIIFGVFLQKARVVRYEKQVGAMLFKDMTIFKFMLSSILVAMVGIYLLYDLGMVEFDLKPTILGALVVGGLVFGFGWGLLGYCPGTAGGALGEGRYDAFFGILGMLLGGALYAHSYPLLSETVLTWGDLGKIRLPEVLGVNHWLVILPFAAGVVLLFRWFEKKGL
jgi:uncharacterized membrane protein YedE/YeeE